MVSLKRLKRIARWLQRRYGPNRLILMYHRVARPEVDPWALCVSPMHFAQQIEVLQRRCLCLPLEEFARGLVEGRLPRRAVAVTFDDGYADNLHRAKPVLERYGVPATVFLATGYLGVEREFWWDELERMLLHPGQLPGTLTLEGRGRRRRWDLGEAIEYRAENFERHRGWRGWDDPPTARQKLYLELYWTLRGLPTAEREAALDLVSNWTGLPRLARPSHRVLTHSEAADLARWLTIGAHTVTHPDLPELSKPEQRDEIERSKTDCERLIGAETRTFSYPFSALTEETRDLVQDARMTCACMGYGDLHDGHLDPLKLPRMPVFDWDGEEFARRLALS